MRRFLPRLAAGCLFLSLPAASEAAETVELRWQFKKGQVFKYRMKHREVRTVSAGDQTIETTTDTEYEWQWTVRDLDDKGAATLEQKLTALRLTCNGQNFEFGYDSSRGNRSDEEYKRKLIDFLDQLRFTTYQLRVRPDGQVAEVRGFDKLLDEFGNPQNIVDFHALSLHDDTFGWFLQLQLGSLPGAAAARGATWKLPTKAKLEGFGGLSGKVDVTLGKAAKAGDHACEELNLKGEQTLDLDMKWLNTPLRGPLKSTKLTGTVLFDAKAGLVRGGKVETDLEGSLKLGANDQAGALKITYRHALELELKP